MKEQFFVFKKFKLKHGGSSFKVNTDAVLLGAWAGKGSNPRSILDIGTGSGIIALMLAQRFQNAKIQALDINKEAVVQAESNFLSSPWSRRMQVVEKDIKKDRLKMAYDLIVCNPPFFIQSLKSSKALLNGAKHDLDMSLADLFSFVSIHLNLRAHFYMIFPSLQEPLLLKKAEEMGFKVKSANDIFTKPGGKRVRTMYDFEKASSDTIALTRSNLYLENQERHSYHQSYINLCKEFYLKF